MSHEPVFLLLHTFMRMRIIVCMETPTDHPTLETLREREIRCRRLGHFDSAVDFQILADAVERGDAWLYEFAYDAAAVADRGVS